MSLTIYGFHGAPHDFAVTKINAEIDNCVFFLDFARPLRRMRGVGLFSRWIGPTLVLHVPVVHKGEKDGGYIVGVRRGEPFFVDLPKLWRAHRRTTRRLVAAEPVEKMQIIVDFATHFPDDC